MDSFTYLTTDELSNRIKYDPRTIRNRLKDSGYWQVKSQIRNIYDLFDLSHCPTPFCERTFPEISIVPCSNEMAPMIEQVVNGSMGAQKSLRLPD